MSSIRTKTVKVKAFYTEQELKSLSQEFNRLFQQIEEIAEEAKAVSSDYKTKITNMKAKAREYSNSLSRGYEYKDELCYIHMNYETKMRMLFSVKTGELIDQEEFLPRDYDGIQIDVTMQEAVDTFRSLEEESVSFFREKFESLRVSDAGFNDLVTSACCANTLEEFDVVFTVLLDENRYRFIALLISHIQEKYKDKLPAGYDLEFDLFLDDASGFYDSFITNIVNDYFKKYIEPNNGDLSGDDDNDNQE